MSDPISFASRYSTDRKSRFFGLLPSFATLLTLVSISALLALMPMISSTVAMTASAYIGNMLWAAAVVTTVSFFNFWFAREIQSVALGCGEVKPGEKFDHTLPTDIIKMVNHVRQELNVMDGTEDPNHPNHMPVPRIATFPEPTRIKVLPIAGRNLSRAALYLSTGTINHKQTNFTQAMLAAYLMYQMVIIKNRRGVNGFILTTLEQLSSSLDSLLNSQNFVFKSIGVALIPLRLPLLIHKSVLRSYHYEAVKKVFEAQRGDDLYDAFDKKSSPFREEKLNSKSRSRDLDHAILVKRDPYDQYFARAFRESSLMPAWAWRIGAGFDVFCKPVADWVDSKEHMTDEKIHSWRLGSLFDLLFLDLHRFYTELFSDAPRGANLKSYIKELRKDPSVVTAIPKIDDKDVYEAVDHEYLREYGRDRGMHPEQESYRMGVRAHSRADNFEGDLQKYQRQLQQNQKLIEALAIRAGIDVDAFLNDTAESVTGMKKSPSVVTFLRQPKSISAEVATGTGLAQPTPVRPGQGGAPASNDDELARQSPVHR